MGVREGGREVAEGEGEGEIWQALAMSVGIRGVAYLNQER